MPPNIAIRKPKWVDKVSRSRRKPCAAREEAFSVEHSLQFESDTVTFSQFCREVWGVTSTLASALEEHNYPESKKRSVLSNVSDKLLDMGPQIWSQVCAEAEREFEQADRVVDLNVGPVTYELRRPLKAHISPSANHGWKFSIEQFEQRFVGEADSIDAARRDFLNKVHSTLQSLVRLRPFQMNKTESDDWQVLESLIDVDRYWDSVPVLLLETGVISRATADGWEIVWLDGERKEVIPSERTLPEFAALEKEQWFEALVERQPGTYQLRKLRYVRPIDPIREMSEEEFKQWVNSLPSSEDVPKSGTDWATL